MERSSGVSVEEVVAGIPSGSTLRIDVTGVLLEIWCAHELQWLRMSAIRSPSGRKSFHSCAGILGACGCQKPYREPKPRRPLLSPVTSPP